MVIIEGDGYNDPSSNLDETVFISHRDNTNVKDKNPTILPPPMGKIELQSEYSKKLHILLYVKLDFQVEKTIIF